MITNIQKENLLLIPYKDLYLSEHNVRTVPASKKEDKLLKASIKAQNIKQNLVVIKDGQKFGVIAGGRRLGKVGELVNEGHFKPDHLIPCLLEKDENIKAISLSENIKASMHPADEFVAFQAMVDDGKTVASIASEFGVSQNKIKQRLKMASVSPELLNLYRESKIDLEHIMAFTVSDNHERQLACYKELTLHRMSSTGIKNFLLDKAISIQHGMVKLVTLKAFKKAGGTTTTDMFEAETYVNERELIESMVLDILNKKAKSLTDVWKWVDVSLHANTYDDYQATLSAELANVPKALTDELERNQLKMDELNEKSFSDWTDEDEDLEEKWDDRIEELEIEQEQYRNFSDEQKMVSGAMVGFDSKGTVIIKMGYVKSEDMSLAFPPAKSSKTTSSEPIDTDSAVESNALKVDLNNFKLQAIQSELMKDDKLTYDLMVYSLAKQIFTQNHWCEKPINTSIELANLSATNGIEETQPHINIGEFKETLELTWLSQDSEADKFKAFRELSSVQKKRLLSYSTAMSYRSSPEVNPVVTDAIEFELSKHWKPTKDNYYKRVKTTDLLAIGSQQINKQWAADNSKLSKGQIVDILDGHDSMAGWMPESMK